MAKKKAKAKKKNTSRAAAVRRSLIEGPAGELLMPVRALGAAYRANQGRPAKRLKRSQSTGWIPARRVKIVRRRGRPDQVFVEKPPRKRRKK